MKDVAIVGAGLAGLALAEALLQQGWSPQQIQIWEQHHIGSAASGAPAALVHPYPGRSLFLRSEYAQAWDVAQQWLKPWKSSGLVRTLPLVRPVLDKATALRFQRSWQRTVTDVVWVSPEQLKEHYPGIQTGLGGYLIPKAYGVHLPELLQQLASKLRQQGICIREQTPLCALQPHSRKWLLQSHQEQIMVSQVILTVGVACKRFFPALPLTGIRGELLVAQPFQENPLSCAVSAAGHVLPLEPDKWVVGATFRPAERVWQTDEVQADLLQKAATLLTIPVNPIYLWSGVRAVMQHDREPIVGEVPGHSGLFVMTGFAAKGLLLVPYFAQQLATMLHQSGGQVPLYASPERYPQTVWANKPNYFVV